ncbi:hypothetical protein [Arthrobacter sp. H14]|uniref:hypothetical protein n=1 Tax=Arthrobacter sp. H14 TaxID=1312959 RepID=UPI00047A99CD|nr:hypothetical protein [Arthrobacter sp. H14]
MRLKIAAALVIVGLLTMGLGIAQRTVWAPPETITHAVTGDFEDAPLTVLDHTLNNRDGEVQLTVEGEGEMMLAVGRADDVKAWVGDAAHLQVLGYDGDRGLVAEHTSGETEVPSPRGSDMWQTVETGTDRITYTWADPAPGQWAILLASEGDGPAPADVSLTVPNSEGAPWAIPLIVVGALLTVLGLAMFFGRKKAKPEVEPAPGTRAARRRSEAAGKVPMKERSKAGVGRRSFEGGAAALLSLGLIGGLGGAALATTSEPADQPESGSATDAAGTTTSPEAGAVAGGGAGGYPVLLEDQLQEIMDSVASTVEAADAAKNADDLKQRVAGPALEQRSATYEIQSQNSDYEAPMPISAEPIMAEIITSSYEWPRTVVAVTQSKQSEVPQALVLVQEGPRGNYKLRSAVAMLPGTTFPQAPEDPAETTTLDIGSDKALKHSPDSAMAALADVLAGKESKSADQVAENTFVEQITAFQKEQKKANSKNADISFDHTVVDENTRALRTADGGALVFGYLSNSMKSTPSENGGTVKLDKDYAALAGDDRTEEGVKITFGESVMLYVPAAGSDGKIQVIGAAQNLVDADLMDK